MKHHPHYIIYKQLLRYLSEDEKLLFKKEMFLHNFNNRTFLLYLVKYFDIEKLKNALLIWQDIWIYNYINYDKG